LGSLSSWHNETSGLVAAHVTLEAPLVRDDELRRVEVPPLAPCKLVCLSWSWSWREIEIERKEEREKKGEKEKGKKPPQGKWDNT